MRICFTVLICLLLLGTSARFTVESHSNTNSMPCQTALTLGSAKLSLPDVNTTPVVRIASAINVKALAANSAIRKDVTLAVKEVAVMLLKQTAGRLF